MTKAVPLKGRWRIVEMVLWDRDFLAMMEPAYIGFDGKSGGEFAFGCVTGGIRYRKSPSGIEFTWERNNEMDEASGDGGAEIKKKRPAYRRNLLPQRRRFNLQSAPLVSSSAAC